MTYEPSSRRTPADDSLPSPCVACWHRIRLTDSDPAIRKAIDCLDMDEMPPFQK
ncbi:hypothetical protein [Xylella fastidiosa]|uniref:Uncharacterized protein n=2 Tax=Xylella fastidiosa TaxID=2371 RepID=A0AAJ5R2T1_XYLFS|nr:hypothetical protein [Xylella fastidiosa]WCF28099.1 hypothetical protein OK117_10790 [Xylella fastidiosa subsp. fastidiosa]